MAITHEGSILLDLALPFGAQSSSLNMQLMATFIVRYLHSRGPNTLMYLDDLIGHAFTMEDTAAHYDMMSCEPSASHWRQKTDASHQINNSARYRGRSRKKDPIHPS